MQGSFSVVSGAQKAQPCGLPTFWSWELSGSIIDIEEWHLLPLFLFLCFQNTLPMSLMGTVFPVLIVTTCDNMATLAVGRQGGKGSVGSQGSSCKAEGELSGCVP